VFIPIQLLLLAFQKNTLSMQINRFFVAIIFLMTWPFQVLVAQYSLSGITGGDSKETQLLEGVEVHILELNRTDISEEGGTYIIKGIGAGVFHVQYSKQGYKTELRTILVKDTATVVHVNLKTSYGEGASAVVLQNEIGMPSHFPYSLDHVSENDLLKSGSVDLVYELSKRPGIDIISSGPGFTNPVIRGLSNNRIQVQQYGTRIENQSWYDRSSFCINDNGSSGYEVLKGPASLLYGADAAGGVIIITEEKAPISGTLTGDVSGAFFSNTFGYDLKAGIKGMSQTGFFYGLRTGTESHTSYVQGENSEKRKNTEDLDFAVNSKYKKQNVKAYIGLSKAWGISKLTYSHFYQQAGIIGFEDSIYNDPLRFNEIQRERKIEKPYFGNSSDIISSENFIIVGRNNLKVDLSYQTNTQEQIESFSDQQVTSTSLQLNTSAFGLSYNTDPLKKFGFNIGTQGSMQANKNSGFKSFAPDANTNTFGAYFLMKYNLKRWSFLAGARIDSRKTEVTRYGSLADSLDFRSAKFERDYLPASGSVGLVFRPVDNFSIKLNVSTGFSTPNFSQLYAYGLSLDSSRFELGNDSLLVEQNVNLEVGIGWETNSVSLNASVFYNQLNDHIHLVNTTGYRIVGTDSLIPVYYYNQGLASMPGAEIALSIHPIDVKWIRADISYSMIRGKLDSGGDLGYMPADKASFGIQFRSAKMNYLHRPYLGLVLNYYSEQQKLAEYETASPSYSLLNLHLGGDIKWGQRFLSLSLSANNILNENYTDHLSQLHSIGISNMGRNVVIRFSMPFGIVKMK